MLYKTANKITLNQPYLEHMPPLAIKLHGLLFDDLFKYHCSIFMYKTKYDLLLECISSIFIKLIDIHNRTRNCECNFFFPSLKNDVCKRFISFVGIQIWSDISFHNKSLVFRSFKKKLFANFSSAYN